MGEFRGPTWRAWIAGILVVAAAATCHSASGAPNPPYSYTKPSEDGRYLFVMISPTTLEEETSHYWPSAAKVREIRARYAESGLYRNDNSTTPLWTVDWYAPAVEVEDPLSDGIHLVRFVYNEPVDENSEVIAFFAEGKMLRSYSVRELVLFPGLLRNSRTGHVRCVNRFGLHEGNRTFTIGTPLGDYYVFDVTTGRIVSSRRPMRWAICAIGILAVGAAAFILLRKATARRRAGAT